MTDVLQFNLPKIVKADPLNENRTHDRRIYIDNYSPPLYQLSYQG